VAVEIGVAIQVTQLDFVNGPCGIGGALLEIGIDTDNDGVVDAIEESDEAFICPLP
jgi:hypothetical protein